MTAMISVGLSVLTVVNEKMCLIVILSTVAQRKVLKKILCKSCKLLSLRGSLPFLFSKHVN